MTNFVLDASVAMRWFVSDGGPRDLAYADKVLAAMKTATAIVPVVWNLEVANVVARAEAAGGVEVAQSGSFLNLLAALDIKIDVETSDHALSDTLQLSRSYRLSSYDASYLELALRRAIPLATLDKDLRKAAKKAGAEVFE